MKSELRKLSEKEYLKKLKEAESYYQSADIKKGYDLGAVDYLIKVYNIPSEVVDKVKSRLKR